MFEKFFEICDTTAEPDPGDFDENREKTILEIVKTNVWNSTNVAWLNNKAEWNSRIEAAGKKYGVENPRFATREGCWQGEKNISTYITGKTHNDGASVLDPFACEILLRVFMPMSGKKVYNPFGGGVQFGFVAGSLGYEYLSCEIRQNQCDANNRICADFNNVKWNCADCAEYEPEGMFDMVFTCPPYYKVEKYVDYDGAPPKGEINAMNTYSEFLNALFRGYTNAINHLNDGCFFVAMVGDSRDKRGAYYGMEADTEIFLRNSGLKLYNKIVFNEAAFTRVVQAKNAIDSRKFLKQEQKIIIAYKGDLKRIKNLYPPLKSLLQG